MINLQTKKLFLLLFSVISIFVVVDSQATEKSDYRYKTVKYLGIDAPIEVASVFDYKQQTFIELGKTPSSNDVNVELGAFACSGLTLIEVPLTKNNNQYTADGIFDSIFLFRHSGAVPARALFNGLVRVDYGGDNWLDSRLGRDDCLTLFTNFFAFLANGKIEIKVGTLGEENPSTEIQGAMAALVSLVGSPAERYDFPSAAAADQAEFPLTQQQVQMLKVEQVRIPFYTGRKKLGKEGKRVFEEEVLSRATKAKEIVIYSPGDVREFEDAVVSIALARNKKVPTLFDEATLRRQRFATLLDLLVSAGVEQSIVKFADQPANELNGYISKYPYAVNGVIEFYEQSLEQSVFLPPEFITVTVALPPTPIKDVNSALALLPQEQASAFCYAKVDELNIIGGTKGQLLSDVLADFIGKNGRQMIWQVTGGLDWRIDADFYYEGKHFTDTLALALSGFPLQAIMDSAGGRQVVVRLRESTAAESDAINLVGAQ